ACCHTRLTDNLVQFTTARYASNPLVVQGPGAGPQVTAAGVFGDILAIAHSPSNGIGAQACTVRPPPSRPPASATSASDSTCSATPSTDRSTSPPCARSRNPPCASLRSPA